MKLIFNFNWGLMNQLPKKLQERCLEYFSESENWRVRYYVAKHPNTPIYILQKLTEGDSYVAQFAKKNLDRRKT